MNRVLVVDDREENLTYLQALFAGLGWHVDCAHNGREALEMARRKVPDIAIADLLMPVMDGFTLLRHWKSDPLLQSIPFIVYTATYANPDDELLAQRLGADAFIQKPADPQFLLDLVAALREDAALGRTARATEAAHEERAELEIYNATLVRKLEEKSLELEAANRALAVELGELRNAEAALRASQRQQRLILESVGEGILGLEADGRIAFANPAALALFGLSEAETVGQYLHPHVHSQRPDGSAYPASECPIIRG